MKTNVDAGTARMRGDDSRAAGARGKYWRINGYGTDQE
jgi:hypothetical protein